MKILDRYLANSFFRGFLLVLFVLLALYSFIELVQQLDDVGKGSYRLKDAFLFIALTLPRRTVDLLAVSTLLGSIVAMGLLAGSNELMAMQAAGMSARRVCWPVLCSGGLLMVFACLLTEFVLPPMEQQARKLRSLSLTEPGIMLTKQGFWARHGPSFIHVGRTFQDNRAADIEVYELDPQGYLRTFSVAREGVILPDGRWVLRDVEKKIVAEDDVVTASVPTVMLDSFLRSDQVGILQLSPDSLSISELYRYVQVLAERGQNAARYSLAFWQKICLPLTTGAMVLLSLPFAFGSGRGMTVGRRIMMGSMVGTGYFLANQILVHLGLLKGLHAIVTTLAPTAAILVVAIWLFKRLT